MRRRVSEAALTTAILAVTLAIVTWPYVTVLSSALPDSTDPMFSIWRLSWFAHALQARLPIADANIFYPEHGTFAFSDTMFLLDAGATPFLWMGINKVLIYNVLLAIGFIGSGLAFFLAARALDLPATGATVGAVIFTLAPYRIEHIFHLELEWLAGAIGALASIVLLSVRPTWRASLALAGSLLLQFFTSIYYATFLLPLIAAVWACCLPLMQARRRTFTFTVAGGLIAGILASPVVLLHARQGTRLGARPLSQVQQFSATGINYLATPRENVLYGELTRDIGTTERRLFPGVIATTLAIVGLFSRRRRVVIAAVIFIILAVDLSLGTNGLIYPYLYRWLAPWRGLRAAARYAAYALLGISTLAVLGWEVITTARGGRSRATSAVLTAAVIAALCVEYASPQGLLRVPTQAPQVYALINALPAGVILEYPTPAPDVGREFEADYSFWSTTHWRPLINGYSGYTPPSFCRSREAPADVSIR